MSPVSPVLTTPAALRLSLGCDLGGLKIGIRQVMVFLVEQGWSETDIRAVELALVEAGNNAVGHTNPEQRLHPIELEAVSEPGQLELRLTDHTQGFDWPAVIDLPPGGAGTRPGTVPHHPPDGSHRILTWAKRQSSGHAQTAVTHPSNQ